MSTIIATWEQMGSRVIDAGIVSGDDGEPLVFGDYGEADLWIDENDDLVCTHTRIIDLEAG